MGVKILGVPDATKATKTAKELIDVGEKIFEILNKARALHIESREVSIRVPERSCTFDVAVSVRHRGIFSKKVLFPIGNVNHIVVHSLGSSRFARLDNSILRVPHGFELAIDRIPKSVEGILLTFEYDLHNMSFLDNIVQTNVSREPSKERDSYWMHAQLKHLKWFKEKYDRWELQDAEFNVDVAIDNEVKSSIPKAFVRHLELVHQVTSATDRNVRARANMMLSSSRRKIKGDPYSLISSISTLFQPLQFQQFIEVTAPFRYFNSKKGSEFLDFPSQVFPKTMNVTCRTRLDLGTPAHEGELFYKKRDLYKAIREIFKL